MTSDCITSAPCGAGARGYIMKSETAKRVIMAIRQVLAGKIYMSESLTALFAERIP